MQRAILALALSAALAGCTSVTPTADEINAAGALTTAPIPLKLGVMAKDPSHFQVATAAAGSGSSATNCVLVTNAVLEGYVNSMRVVFEQVVLIKSASDCPDCDLFSSFDASIQFGSVSGYNAQVSADYLARDGKRVLTSISSLGKAIFDQTNASSIGMTLINGASLGVLAPVTQPLGQQMQCSFMQSRAETIFNQLLAETAVKARADAALSVANVKAGTSTATAVIPAASSAAAATKETTQSAATPAASAAPATAERTTPTEESKNGEPSTSNSTAVTPKATAPVSTRTMDEKFNDLTKLKELLDKGILTQSEFDAEKAKVLSQ